MADISHLNTGRILSKSIASHFKKATTKTVSLKEMIDEHQKLIRVLESSSRDDDKEEAKKQTKELEEYKKEFAKSGDAVEARRQIDWSERLKRLRERREDIEKANGIRSYADMIVVNSKGQILLLKRSKLDSFGGSKWSLPGGTIEVGESPMQAAIRELAEETAITLWDDLNPPMFLTEIDNGQGSTSSYFFVALPPNAVVTIDNNEHENYMWADKDAFMQCDCILDLKERLLKILTAWFAS